MSSIYNMQKKYFDADIPWYAIACLYIIFEYIDLKQKYEVITITSKINV